MENTTSRETTAFLELIKPQKTEYFDIADQNTNAEILDEALKQHAEKLESHSDRLKNLETGVVSEVQTTRDHVSAFPESTLSGGSVEVKNLKGLTLVQQQSDRFENMWDTNILLDSTLVYKNSSVGIIDNQSGTTEKTAGSYKRTVLSDGDIIFMGVFAKCETGTANVNILSIGLDKNDNQIDTVQSDVEEITDMWQFYGTVGQHTGETLTCAVQRLKVASFGTESDKVYFSRPYYINLTAIGLEDLTYSQLAYMVQAANYWEGFRSIENVTFESQNEKAESMGTSVLTGTFRSLPNGVSDGIECSVVDGMKHIRKVEKISEEIILDENDDWVNLYIQSTDTVRVGLPYFVRDYYEFGDTSVDDIEHFSNDRLPQKKMYTTDEEGMFINSEGSIFIRVNKSKLESVDIIGFRKYIAQNPITFIYQKNTTTYGKWQNCTPASYENGSLALSSDSGLIPEIEFTTPVNQGAVLTDVAQKVTTHQAFIEKLTGVEVPPKALTHEKPTVSFEVNNGGIEPIVKGRGQLVTNHACAMEEGGLYWIGGELLDASDRSRSVDFIPVKSNTTYSCNKKLRGWLEYDIEKNWVSNEQSITKHKTSDKAAFIKVVSVSQIPESDLMILEGEYEADEMPEYVVGTQTLSDIAIDIRGENLAPELNEWHLPTGLCNYECLDKNTVKFTNETKANNFLYSPLIPVKANTNYYCVCEHDEGQLAVVYYDKNKDSIQAYDVDVNSIRTSPKNAYYARLRVGRTLAQDIGTATFTKIDFRENSEAPSLYESPYNSTTYINSNEHFTEKDSFIIRNGKMVVERKMTNPIMLDGQADEWTHSNDAAGFKVVQLPLSKPPKTNSGIVTKYNGIVLLKKMQGHSVDSDDSQIVLDSTDIRPDTLLVSIRNIDSGWGEAYTPTDDEVKAYFNGWVMYYLNESTSEQELYADQNGDETGKRWSKRYQNLGTQFELSFGALVESSSERLDICPKEKAYGDATQCYTLQYELAEPESYEVDLWGTPRLPEGKCQVTLRSGIRCEKSTPVMENDGDVYHINNIGYSGATDNPLSKKAERIINIFRVKEGVKVDDIDNWTLPTDSYKYGNQRAAIQAALFDTEAEYYVVYETLSEENNTGIFTSELTYTDDAQSVVNALGKTLANTEDELEIAKAQLSELTEKEVYEPRLLNGFSVEGTNTPTITKIGNMVRISGAVTDLTNATKIFNNPWPPSELIVARCASQSAAYQTQVNVDPNGQVLAFIETGATKLWLDVVYFI